MYCFQCQEATNGVACKAKAGYCGKTDEVADLQDLIVYLCKGVAWYAQKARKAGIETKHWDKLILDNLFLTVTNVNFDPKDHYIRVEEIIKERDELKSAIEDKGKTFSQDNLPECTVWTANTKDQMREKAEEVGVLNTENEDIRSLRELVTYGIKGIAAYGEHAFNLGYTSDAVFEFVEKGLAATLDDSLGADELTALVLETGKFGVETMALLDKAHNETYGHPEITKVNLGVRNRPAILISGHDMKDMEELLKQTEGTGVDVYTHSEMLPAHYYPAFKKYDHFVGNYGNSWWRQVEEFETFNGPILFTTNCLVPPKKKSTYGDRVYTTGPVGFSGFKHIPGRENGNPKDFSVIIEHAKKCLSPEEIETGEIVGGFAHHQIEQLADK
ncbi:MAG: hydroxylamine reductase, partial [Candidatus Kapaibacterium sp.]